MSVICTSLQRPKWCGGMLVLVAFNSGGYAMCCLAGFSDQSSNPLLEVRPIANNGLHTRTVNHIYMH